MVLYPVYSQEHRTRYLADLCSIAFFFQIICLICTFLPPLFTGYFTSGFYYKELTYTEQPNITYLNRYNLILDSSTSSQFSSSDLRSNQFFRSQRFSSNLRSSLPEDLNKDDRPDQEIIYLDLLTSGSLAGTTIHVWLIFNYSLTRFPLVQMQTLGLFSLRVPPNVAGSSAVNVYGSLRFLQREPVTSSTNYTINQNLLDYGSSNIQPSFDETLANYNARVFSTKFEPSYVQWSIPPSTTPPTTSSLTIKVVINYYPQVIRYVPSFWKEFRWAWINYVAGLVPFFYLINKVKEFAFSNGLVRTVVARST